MRERRALSKSTRFNIFSRDFFTCQYCGRRPPEVVLEVDHVLALARGGSDDEHNLLTSCFNCNRGKRDKAVHVAPIDVAARTALIKERAAQVAAYEDALRQERASLERDLADVCSIYEVSFNDYTLNDSSRQSVRKLLAKLPASDVMEAMDMACSRIDDAADVFRYFCGICWRWIKEGRQ